MQHAIPISHAAIFPLIRLVLKLVVLPRVVLILPITHSSEVWWLWPLEGSKRSRKFTAPSAEKEELGGRGRRRRRERERKREGKGRTFLRFFEEAFFPITDLLVQNVNNISIRP
jgi:hypothetical protein